MKENEILRAIEGLAKNDRFYNGLYEYLLYLKEYDVNNYFKTIDEFEEQNFADIVDLIIYLES